MAAPAYGNAGTLLSTSSGTTASFAVPAGVASGDLIVVAFFLDGAATVTAYPSGFAEAENSPILIPAGGGQHSLHVTWKRASGADAGTYDFTLSSAAYREGAAHRYTGAVTSGTPFDSPTGSAVGSVNGTTTPAVSTTTLGADRMLLFAATDWSGGSWTPPSGYTERMDSGVGLVTLADLAQAVAGSSGSVTATPTASDKRAAWIGALIPASSAITGSASAVGVGSATAVVTQRGTASPAGAGAATALGRQLAAASPAGAGAAVAAASQILRAASSAAGTGTATAGAVQAATASAAGAGSAAANAAGTVSGTATAAGAGVAMASSTLRAVASATGAGIASAAGQITGTASAAGTGAAAAAVRIQAGASVVGAGAATANVQAVIAGTASAVGAGVVIAVAGSRTTPRPYAGITTRPGAGSTARPYTGITVRP